MSRDVPGNGGVPIAAAAGGGVVVDAQDIIGDDVPQEDGRHLVTQRVTQG